MGRRKRSGEAHSGRVPPVWCQALERAAGVRVAEVRGDWKQQGVLQSTRKGRRSWLDREGQRVPLGEKDPGRQETCPVGLVLRSGLGTESAGGLQGHCTASGCPGPAAEPLLRGSGPLASQALQGPPLTRRDCHKVQGLLSSGSFEPLFAPAAPHLEPSTHPRGLLGVGTHPANKQLVKGPDWEHNECLGPGSHSQAGAPTQLLPPGAV